MPRGLRRPALQFALSVAVVAGCTGAPTAPTTSAPYSQTDLRIGTGDAAEAHSFVTVDYTGWFYDSSKPDNKGVQFDSSAVQPFSFILGSSQVIDGWNRGVPGMRVGGLRRLVIPPSLGYGATRNGPIPPNSTLLFDIELLRVGVEATPAGASPARRSAAHPAGTSASEKPDP
jgi:FKBP-type peptidyl-prolyl cis-trans isomerase FkpA